MQPEPQYSEFNWERLLEIARCSLGNISLGEVNSFYRSRCWQRRHQLVRRLLADSYTALKKPTLSPEMTQLLRLQIMLMEVFVNAELEDRKLAMHRQHLEAQGELVDNQTGPRNNSAQFNELLDEAEGSSNGPRKRKRRRNRGRGTA